MAREGGIGGTPYGEVAALLAVATEPSDTASYLRGKAWIAGLRDHTPLATACDVILALECDGAPTDQIKKWRQNLDRQLMVQPTKPASSRGPDRATWGLLPEQIRATSKLTAGAKPPPGVTPIPLRE